MQSKLMPTMLLALAAAGCGGPDDDPVSPASEATGEAKGTAAMLPPHEPALEAWLRSNSGAGDRIGYRSSEYDLDGDGTPDVLAYVSGGDWCSEKGCSLLVFERDGATLRQIVRIGNTRLPLGVLDSESNGWPDLWVSTAGSDELSGRRILKFDGTRYPADPTGPSTEPLKILDTQVLIADGDLVALN